MKAKPIKDLHGLKLRTLKFFKKLAQEKGWKYDLNKVNSWRPWKYQRSFYTKIILSDGRKGFFKCPVSSSAREDFLRELAYLEHIGKKHGDICVQIYDYSRRKGSYWMVTEFVDSKKGVLVESENTNIYRDLDMPLILGGLESFENFAVPSSSDLLSLSKYPVRENTFNYFIRKLQRLMRIVEKNKERAPHYPFLLIEEFLTKMKVDFSKRSREYRIIHGDIAPNNVFIDRKKRRIIFLDWEKAFVTKNTSLYCAFDFANFYFRCWKNLDFQKALLQSYLKQKSCVIDELKLACILQNLRQIRYLIDSSYDVEKGNYLKTHIRRISQSLETVLML